MVSAETMVHSLRDKTGTHPWKSTRSPKKPRGLPSWGSVGLFYAYKHPFLEDFMCLPRLISKTNKGQTLINNLSSRSRGRFW